MEKNTQISIVGQQTIEFKKKKNEQEIWSDTSPEKIYK